MTPEQELNEIRTLLREAAEIGNQTSKRLDRLTERHEGLTESVELLVHEGRDILRKLGGKGGKG